MTRDEGKVLIGKWREKVLAYGKMEEIYRGRGDKHDAYACKRQKEAFEQCAEDLDRALGRVS